MISFPVPIGNQLPLVVMGGVNVLENIETSLEIANAFKDSCEKLGMGYVFKASFDKANRSAYNSYRGPGLQKGLEWLKEIRNQLDIPVLTDVHDVSQVKPVSEVCDVLQLPAFLARQTDLVSELASCGRPIHIKKPQFLSPQQVRPLVQKFENNGCHDIVLCERGSCFGYDNQIVDILGLSVMRDASGDKPISVDVTHSLQCRAPGALQSGGRRSQLMPLSKAVVASGIAAIFVEAHPRPDEAPCDGASALPLSMIGNFLNQVAEIDRLVKRQESLKIA